MITFAPDLEKFGMTELTDDVIALLSKCVHDIAGTVKDVKVFLNDKCIQAKNFKEYVQMYLKSVNANTRSSKINVIHEKFGEHWEASIAPSVEGQFQQVIFCILYTYIHMYIHMYISLFNNNVPFKIIHVYSFIFLFFSFLKIII